MHRTKKERSKEKPARSAFSKRQLDVIESWGKSFDPEAVAQELGIKVNSIQTHLRRMRKKLGVKRTVEVWEYSVRLRENHP